MEQMVIESPLLEEWLRTVCLDDDGRVFLPCGAFADEPTAFMCLAYDGGPLVRHEGHIYAPASWLAKEYPRYAAVINTIAARVRTGHQCMATAGSGPGGEGDGRQGQEQAGPTQQSGGRRTSRDMQGIVRRVLPLVNKRLTAAGTVAPDKRFGRQ